MINLIFDYDGTLHETMYIYGPALRLANDYLISKGYVEDKYLVDKEISKWLGFTAKDMWNTFVPGLPEEEKDKCSKIVGEEMVRLIKAGEARLYKDIPQVLKNLKEKEYNLIFLSNCKKSYLKAHRDYFNLDQYFSDFYCAEAYDWLPKEEIFKSIKEKYSGKFIVIGDRFHDIEVGIKHNLKTIGCLYGYNDKGELSKATVLAETPKEMEELIYSLY